MEGLPDLGLGLSVLLSMIQATKVKIARFSEPSGFGASTKVLGRGTFSRQMIYAKELTFCRSLQAASSSQFIIPFQGI